MKTDRGRSVSGGVGDLEGDPRNHSPASPLVPFLSPVRIEEDERSRLQTSGRESREHHATGSKDDEATVNGASRGNEAAGWQ